MSRTFKVVVIGSKGELGSRLVLKIKQRKLPVTVVPIPSAVAELNLDVIASADLVVLATKTNEALSHSPIIAAASRVLDLSPAHRLDDEWSYGLPELLPGSLLNSRKVANPGCFSQAAILILAPLVREGLLDVHSIISVLSIGGASSGGSAMSEALANGSFEPKVFSVSKPHPHIAEIRKFSGFNGVILGFTPVIGAFYSGTYLQIDIPGLSESDVLPVLFAQYANTPISVEKLPKSISVTEGSGITSAKLFVGDFYEGVRCICVLDNLEKGGAESAVINLMRMLGL